MVATFVPYPIVGLISPPLPLSHTVRRLPSVSSGAAPFKPEHSPVSLVKARWRFLAVSISVLLTAAWIGYMAYVIATDTIRAKPTREAEASPTAEYGEEVAAAIVNYQTPQSNATTPPCLTGDQLAEMGREQVSQLEVLCFKSDSGDTTIVNQVAAVQSIRGAVQRPNLALAFQEMTGMVNSPNGDLRVARFIGDQGAGYLLDLEIDKLLEIDPAAYAPEPGPGTYSQDELRVKAEQFVAKELPGFAAMRSRLKFEEGTKDRSLYFFRWEDRSSTRWSHMPPLAQVGITTAGEIISYINTLYFSQ